MSKFSIIIVMFAILAGCAVGCWVDDAVVPEGPTSRSKGAARDVVFDGEASAVREILLEFDTFARTAQLAALFRQLDPDSLAAVRAGYDSIVLDPGGIATQLLAEWWAGFDPAAAFRWTRDSYVADRPAVIMMVLRAWARTDPQAALSAIPKTRNIGLSQAYLDMVLEGWQMSERPGLDEYVRNLGDAETRGRVAARLARLADREAPVSWADGIYDRQRTDAVREILLKPDALERTAELAALFRQLDADALPAVRAAYDSVVLDPISIESQLLAEWWARFDPDAAFEWARRNHPVDRPVVTFVVLRALARIDPEAAWDQAADTEASLQLRFAYMRCVLEGWEESGVPGLHEFVEGLGFGEQRQRALMVLARRTVQRDGPEAAFAWAEDIDGEEQKFKLNAFRRVGRAVAEVAPEQAAAWATRHLDGPFGNSLPQFVAKPWAKRDAKSALEWLSTLPPDQGRGRAVSESYRVWRQTDATGSREWLFAQPLEPWMDPVIEIHARSIEAGRSLEAISWASRISDETLRQATQTRIARVWLARDEAAANAWIDASDLSELLKQKARTIPPAIKKAVAQERREARARSAELQDGLAN